MNKMKDFDAKSKEWWEVIEEYFSKELKKNLEKHKANERTYKYKLELFQRTFPNFVCASPTSIKVSSQNEENEARPNGTAQEEEVQVDELWIFKGGS